MDKRLLELIESAKAKVATPSVHLKLPADSFEWNPQQADAIERAVKGGSFNLIGAAGTGKTTTEKEITRRLIVDAKVPPIDMSTKYLEHGRPGIVITSFTRRAVRNSRKVVVDELKPHCITLHKLLEFEPMYYDVMDPETQKMKTTMRFEPQRNRLRKLPNTLKTIIIDESPMVSVALFKMLVDALPNPNVVQFIFVGDLHQLPPVYGQAILGFKLLELPTVELTHIYRQAQESPIIALAHKVKNGEDVPVAMKSTMETAQGKVTIHPWKKPISDFDGQHTAGLFLKQLIESNNFNEEEDIVLCPQEKVSNRQFGTNEFNRRIAQSLGEKRKAIVWEIIAGFQRHYYAVGDRVMVGREDGVITEIKKNARYWSTKRARPPSEFLDRWGNYGQKPTATDDDDDFDADAFLDAFTLEGDEKDEERKNEASHTITVQLLDTGATEVVSTAGEINAMQFAYALTVHKSQGSEWDRVFFLTHQSHVTMWSRELLYTAITRAKKELYMIVEPDRKTPGTLTKAARSPRIKGDTLAEKAEYFKGKQEEYEEQMAAGSGLPQGKATPGQYKGMILPKSAPAPEPVKLVKLETLVSEAFKAEAITRLQHRWINAKGIWGAKIGDCPTLAFDLQRAKIIGLACLGDGIIRLNPLWCILAEEEPYIKKEMLEDTIDHEMAHFIAHRFSGDKGHNTGWTMAMKLLGREANATCDTLPGWCGAYADLLSKTKSKLAGIADFTEEKETETV